MQTDDDAGICLRDCYPPNIVLIFEPQSQFPLHLYHRIVKMSLGMKQKYRHVICQVILVTKRVPKTFEHTLISTSLYAGVPIPIFVIACLLALPPCRVIGGEECKTQTIFCKNASHRLI
jgi:hypothetical protein